MISILCPTKYRPDGLRAMWESALETSSVELELVLYVDEYDQLTLKTVPTLRGNVKLIVGDGTEIYSNLHNICCEESSHDLFMGAADDIIFRTPGWDALIIEKFSTLPDKIGYIYPNDGHNGEKLGTHGFFHKNWFRTLGYIAPPIFTVDYSDNYIMDVARGVNRCIYVPEVLAEHMHWTFNKSEFDRTAQIAHQKRTTTNNSKIYSDSQDLINRDIGKLNESILLSRG